MTKYNSVDVSSIVVIDDWSDLDERPVGSREKKTVIDPDTGQYYVFKKPNDERRSALIWSELIASYIAGDLLGWPVQHTQIGLKDGEIGNLLRYIYDPKEQQMIAGEQLCLNCDPDFDVKQGKRHRWDLIFDIHNTYWEKFKSNDTKGIWTLDFMQYWSRAIAFDTLISNSDRHAENWSLILPLSSKKNRAASDLLAPLYDNGSSMGCEVDPVGLDRWFDQEGNIMPAKLERYCQNGCHHMRGQNERYPFEELCKISLKSFTFPVSEVNPFREKYEAVASLDLSKLDVLFDDIEAMSGLPESAKMTARRREQITQLLRMGQQRVKRSLEETL